MIKHFFLTSLCIFIITIGQIQYIKFYLYIQDRKLMPRFVLKDMEGLFIEEMNSAINLLKVTISTKQKLLNNNLFQT